MAALPIGVDPTALADLKAAAETYSFFQSLGEPVEFWEVVRLAKSNRSLLEFQMKTPSRNRETLNPILEELKPIRQQLSATVRKLRDFIENAPGKPDNSERLELALSLLLASAKDQKLIAGWLAEPDKGLRKAGAKLSAIASIADPYREALLPWRLTVAKPKVKPKPEATTAVFHVDSESPSDDGEPADPFDADSFEPLVPMAQSASDPEPEPEPPPPGVETESPAPSPTPTIDVDPAVLEDLRLAFRVRAVLDETMQQSDMWEVILLSMTHRTETRRSIEAMAKAKEEKKPARFHESACNLYTRLLAVRSKEAVWVRPLRNFLSRLPIEGMTRDALEVALGLLVVSTIGRKEAKKWLDEPGRHVDEAVGRLRELVAQARAYQTSAWSA